MSRSGRAWVVHDRYGDEVYLTWERWEHIVLHHPSMQPYFDELRETAKKGHCTQDEANPMLRYYVRGFDDLPDEFNALVAVVVTNVERGERFVVTGYLQWIHSKEQK